MKADTFARWYGGAMLFFIVTTAFCFIVYQPSQYHYDDAFICYRYAVNLAEGRGLVFNVGEKADAASSFLYTVVLAGFYKLGFHNLEVVVCWINMVSLFLVGWITLILSSRMGAGRYASIAMGVLVSLHGWMSGWAALGMETALYSALLIIWLAGIMNRNHALVALMTVLACLTRHEAVILLPFTGYWMYREDASFRLWMAAYAAVLLFHLGRVIYYGQLFPDAMLAKQVLPYYHAQPKELLKLWMHYAPLLFPFALWGAWKDRRLVIPLAAAGAMFTACLFGIMSDFGRYSAPLLPLLAVMSAPLMKGRVLSFVIPAHLAVCAALSASFFHTTIEKAVPVQEAREEMGKICALNIPENEWIISSDLGAIGYFCLNHRFIDLNGLTSRDVLEARRQANDGRIDLSGIFREKKPKWVADTFQIAGKNVEYRQLPGMNMVLRAGKRVSGELAIGVAEITGGR